MPKIVRKMAERGVSLRGGVGETVHAGSNAVPGEFGSKNSKLAQISLEKFILEPLFGVLTENRQF